MTNYKLHYDIIVLGFRDGNRFPGCRYLGYGNNKLKFDHGTDAMLRATPFNIDPWRNVIRAS
jgi:hypothetical protein